MKRVLLFFVFLSLSCSGSSVSPDDVVDIKGGEQVTGNDTVSKPQCKKDSDCQDVFGDIGSCRMAICNLQGRCVLKNKENGTECDDGNLCTKNDKCDLGECKGTVIDCNDDNVCTTDTCDPEKGCVHEFNEASCDDGDLCTINDHCVNGECKGDPNPACQCDTDDDCKQFDDGNLCNGVKKCVNHQCIVDPSTIVTCDPSQASECEEVYCEESTGQCKKKNKENGTPCSDGNYCTIDDKCNNGKCEGTPKTCNDNNPCTDDTCDPTTGCVFTNNNDACDDGDPCTINDKCSDGECKGEPNPECQCSTDNDCKPYDDGNLCNGTMKCIDGKCVIDETTIVKCDESLGGPCKEVYCEETTGQCKVKNKPDGTACDDKNACTENDYCKEGICVGNAIVCNDNNPCTDDSCDPEKGCVYENNSNSCDDGDPCTKDDTCVDGKCVGTQIEECQCTSDDDCKQFDDNDLCNGKLICVDNKCVLDTNSIVECKNDNPCQTVVCVPETGECKYTNVEDGTECDDNDACTTKSVCKAGKCTGIEELNCDDGNICTDDKCHKDIGCYHEFNSNPCDDGNNCTENDVCVEGKCTGTPIAECQCETDADCASMEDGNLCNGTLICVENKCVVDPETVVTCPENDPNGCKISYCNPSTGQCEEANVPDGKVCDDGDMCTTVDYCSEGKCVSAGKLDCNDDNPCTDDVCDPATGCVHFYNDNPCDDGDPCTEGDVCVEGVCQPGSEYVCGESCEPAYVLNCGDSDTWNTTYYGSTNNITSYSCSEWDYTGPEYTYAFTAPFDGKVRVTLTNEEAITDIMVLDNTGQGCNSDFCRAYDYSKVEVEMKKDQKFYFVVDGYDGAKGGYTITVDCIPNHEINCSDGKDDDEDNLIDCDDDDCIGTEACPVPHCEPAWVIACDESDSWWNSGGGSTNYMSEYSCTDWTFTGPEYAYKFVSPVDGEITVSLSDMTQDLDILVLKSADNGDCLPDNCVAWDYESVTFQAEKGAVYYFVVDGYNGAKSFYKIDVKCPSQVETNCSDDIDNDNDNKVDCDDEDCAEAEACKPKYCEPAYEADCDFEETYSTAFFDATDIVEEYSCAEGTTYPGSEYTYTFVAPKDGKLRVTLSDDDDKLDIFVIEAGDNDVCDPKTNCLDTADKELTFQVTKGKKYYIVVDSQEDYSGSYHIKFECFENTETSCNDTIDNDLDSAIDCEDSDCFKVADNCPACTDDFELFCGYEEDWNNGNAGSTNVITQYACSDWEPYDGPEYTYRFTTDQEKDVTITLTDETAETDIIILQDKGLGCNPASCLTYGFSEVTFHAVPGVTYYVVIDGFDSSTNEVAGDYHIKVSCQ